MQIPTGRIMKAPDFATSQGEATNCVHIARSAFQAVPKVDRAQFVLVGSLDAIAAHRDEETSSSEIRENGADDRLCRDQRGRVKPLGPICGDNACVPALVRWMIV
jgi:hypothetical protein